MPEFVTKFVPPEFYEETLGGHLRIGTLQEFREWEDGESRLRDTCEGIYSDVVPGDVQSLSMRMDHIHLRNVSFAGASKANIKVDTYFHALVYCVTSGEFDPEVQESFIRSGNSSLTCHVVFDARKLVETLVDAINFHRNDEGIWVCRRVDYVGEKSHDQPADQLKAQYDQITGQPIDPMDQLTKAIFNKPMRFAHEREIRLAAVFRDSQSESPLLLKNLPSRFAENVRNSIVRSGC